MGYVPGFDIELNGLHYQNIWPEFPDITFPKPFEHIHIGLTYGLCGGMSFSVRDLFEAHKQPPTAYQNPKVGSPAFKYLVMRLIDSFDMLGLQNAVGRFYEWMSLPREDLPVIRGLSWRSINEEMPKICACIDSQHLCPIGLVRVLSTNPEDLCINHQVLVYGYEEDGPFTTLRIWDPNPEDHRATMQFDCTHPTLATDFNYSTQDGPVFGFFMMNYSLCDPSPLFEDGLSA